jgi:hypothetical protein
LCLEYVVVGRVVSLESIGLPLPPMRREGVFPDATERTRSQPNGYQGAAADARVPRPKPRRRGGATEAFAARAENTVPPARTAEPRRPVRGHAVARFRRMLAGIRQLPKPIPALSGGQEILARLARSPRACHSQEQPGGAHARRRIGIRMRCSATRFPSNGSRPTAGNPDDGRYGPSGAVVRVCPAVPPDRPALDSAREAAPRPSAADAVLRSERQLMEQRDYNLLFRWFVGLSMTRSGIRPCLPRTGSGCCGGHRPGLLQAGVGAGAGPPAPLG